jgi:hypothetical protein
MLKGAEWRGLLLHDCRVDEQCLDLVPCSDCSEIARCGVFVLLWKVGSRVVMVEYLSLSLRREITIQTCDHTIVFSVRFTHLYSAHIGDSDCNHQFRQRVFASQHYIIRALLQ